jgi:hypothetical protein
MVGFIAVLEQTPQLQQFWCVNSKKNPYPLVWAMLKTIDSSDILDL